MTNVCVCVCVCVCVSSRYHQGGQLEAHADPLPDGHTGGHRSRHTSGRVPHGDTTDTTAQVLPLVLVVLGVLQVLLLVPHGDPTSTTAQVPLLVLVLLHVPHGDPTSTNAQVPLLVL